MQEEEETDELLLMDEEMLDAPPEDLPRRLLTNFAVYNAEVGSEDSRPYTQLHSRRASASTQDVMGRNF